jgi:guanylate kinase
MKKLLILSGPSCVGKTPLLKALKKNHPEIVLALPIFYTSRPPRPIEQDGVDYHFRTEEQVRALPRERYVIGPVRHIWQAVDSEEIALLLSRHDNLLLEIHPTLANLFLQHAAIKRLIPGVTVLRVFISPVTDQEIIAVQKGMGFSSAQDAVAAIMTQKLIARTLQQGKLLTPSELKDISIRAGEAFAEIQMGKSYDRILVNHDGEDSSDWKFSPPLGEAGRTLYGLAEILK